MTHYVHTDTVRDRAARQASRYDRENEAVSARRYGLSARTIHNRLRKKKLSHQCGPPLIGQTMTRRHRLAYVQLERRHFIWQCVHWNRVSFSCETRFALSMLMVKRTNKRFWDCYVLERDRFGGGSFVVLGGKMDDQKTYFVVMQDNFNALYRRHFVTSCHAISPLFLHIKNW